MRRILIVALIALVLAPAAHAGVAVLAGLEDFDDFGFGARWTLPFPITGSSFGLGKLGAFIEGKAVLGDNTDFVATFGLQF